MKWPVDLLLCNSCAQFVRSCVYYTQHTIQWNFIATFTRLRSWRFLLRFTQFAIFWSDPPFILFHWKRSTQVLFVEISNVLIAQSTRVIRDGVPLARTQPFGIIIIFLFLISVSAVFEMRATSEIKQRTRKTLFLWWFTAILGVRRIERKVSINIYILFKAKNEQNEQATHTHRQTEQP